MGGSFKIDDDDEYGSGYEARPRRRKKRREPEGYNDYVEPRGRYRDPSRGSDSGINTIWVVAIMGAILLGAVWFIASAQPALPDYPDYPNITIPECPQCPDLICEKNEYICNPTIILENITEYSCSGNYTEGDCVNYVKNLKQNITMRFMNSSDTTDFVEYLMYWNESGIYNTTELNITKISEFIGDYWIIQTEVE